jgi:hypothetical protein
MTLRRTAAGLIGALVLVACTDGSTGEKAATTTSPSADPSTPTPTGDLIDEHGTPVALLAGPTGAHGLVWFTATRVIPGELYWSGLSTITASTEAPVSILDATVLAGEGVTPVGVFVGEDDVDGIPGTTPRKPPGDELPGAPAPAAGSRLEPGVPMIVYVVVSLDAEVPAAVVLGVELTVTEGHGTRTLTVLSPTALCVAEVSDEPACAEATSAMVDNIDALMR